MILKLIIGLKNQEKITRLFKYIRIFVYKVRQSYN